MKTWHISITTIILIFIASIVTSNFGLSFLSAILILTLFPALIWLGWTLHERSLHINEILEQRVIDRLRKADPNDIVVRRSKVNRDV